MSRSRAIIYRARLFRILTVPMLVMVLSFVFFAFVAYAQVAELQAGTALAKEVSGSTLAHGAVILSGACVAGMCFTIKIAYQMHVRQTDMMARDQENHQRAEKERNDADMRRVEALVQLAQKIEALTTEIRRNPCLLGRSADPRQGS